MARSTVSFVMLDLKAAVTAARRRGLPAGSGRPALAETVISRISLANARARRRILRTLAVHDVLDVGMASHGAGIAPSSGEGNRAGGRLTTNPRLQNG